LHTVVCFRRSSLEFGGHLSRENSPRSFNFCIRRPVAAGFKLLMECFFARLALEPVFDDAKLQQEKARSQ
jgi:hypothetical protein